MSTFFEAIDLESGRVLTKIAEADPRVAAEKIFWSLRRLQKENPGLKILITSPATHVMVTQPFKRHFNQLCRVNGGGPEVSFHFGP